MVGLPYGAGGFGYEKYRDDISFDFGCNDKLGMDSNYFYSYLNNSICTLYPYAADTIGKRVVIKCVRDTGRIDMGTLLGVRKMGFYIYPTVPNTTHAGQELDVIYEQFNTKSIEIPKLS